ncbi:MAG: hypothetical protein IT378_14425 [Sandaracinaceae bacterium]|nr:hypothetical protein [Sandaracinaceae bacterium]
MRNGREGLLGGARLGAPALLLALLPSCLGAGVPGERYRSDGGCPAGEVCDPDTRGLVFQGAALADVGGLYSRFHFPRPPLAAGALVADLPLVAVDGTEHVTIDTRRFYRASTADPSIATTEPAGDGALLRGAGDGTTLLRVIDAETDALLDRVTVGASTLDRLEPRALPPRGALYDDAVPLWDWPGPWTFMRATYVRAVLAYYDRAGSRLVDESAEIASGALVRGLSWQELELVVPAEGPLRFEVRRGAWSSSVEIPITDRVDRIARLGTASQLLHVPVADGSPSPHCFLALAGTPEAAVAGPVFELETSGPIEATAPLAGEAEGICVRVEPTGDGDAVLTLRAGGAVRRQPFVARRSR